ncbi:MAG TPA: head-tail connector protein [Methylophilaceae bacterium]
MIDLVLARQHLKIDEDDTTEDALVTQYIKSAVSACEAYCNRKFYATQGELDADYIVAKAKLDEVLAARDAELEGVTDCEKRSIIIDYYNSRRAACLRRIHGIVVDDTILAAILMMLGHFYRNRQEVVVAQYSGATQLPAGAKRILEPYVWIGDLGGDA